MIVDLVREEDFDEVTREGTWIVDFFTTHCGPCKAMQIVIDRFIDENPIVNLARCNLDDAPSYRQRFGVGGVPDLMFVSEGEIIGRSVGLLTMEGLEKQVADCLYGA